MRILFFLLVFSAFLFGSEEPKAPTPLSVTGKNRLNQNLLALDQNLKTVTSNVEITKKNIETLHEELHELETLEKDYQALQKRYQDHISAVEVELEKNDKSLIELEKYII